MDAPRIYAIADQGSWGLEHLPAAVATLAEAGVRWIQLRAKQAAGLELYRAVEDAARRLEGSAAVLWVNDRVDIAACLGVGGVHVGQDDLPPAAARQLIGRDVLVGHSTHDEAQLRCAAADPAVDVVALGPIFPTRSKERPDAIVGLEALRRLRPAVDGPLVAIGGIGAERIPAVLDAGADTVALIGALGTDLGSLARRARELQRMAGELV